MKSWSTTIRLPNQYWYHPNEMSEYSLEAIADTKSVINECDEGNNAMGIGYAE